MADVPTPPITLPEDLPSLIRSVRQIKSYLESPDFLAKQIDALIENGDIATIEAIKVKLEKL